MTSSPRRPGSPPASSQHCHGVVHGPARPAVTPWLRPSASPGSLGRTRPGWLPRPQWSRYSGQPHARARTRTRITWPNRPGAPPPRDPDPPYANCGLPELHLMAGSRAHAGTVTTWTPHYAQARRRRRLGGPSAHGGPTVWSRAPFGTSNNAVWHVKGTATPTAVLGRTRRAQHPSAAHRTHTAPAYVSCADPHYACHPTVTGRARRCKFD